MDKTVIITKGRAWENTNALLISAVRRLITGFGGNARLKDVLAALTGGPDKEAA